jgi:short/branched chain acyl-CoA dehydrogenase
MAKYYASNVAQRASGMAIEWAGGVGFTREVGLEKYWRDSKYVREGVFLRTVCPAVLIRFVGRIGAIYEGTSNIQLETIAKLLKKDYV